ncbi:LAMI_0E02938g1_1 [Lachancea mirantina]|uniref:Autophagy-related protein 20 n=1 Tax=Lachancea mirantina TaxID=1230905 RepID=A0A1G4JJS1_9SACH|nr:LAMI_0E02938g1_1 [Lachancea mirantina]
MEDRKNEDLKGTEPPENPVQQGVSVEETATKMVDSEEMISGAKTAIETVSDNNDDEVPTHMVRTEFTQQDNPFALLEESEPRSRATTTAFGQKKKQLVNPNQQYKEELEDGEEEAIHNGEPGGVVAENNSRKSSSGSIDLCPADVKRDAVDVHPHTRDKVYILEASKVSEGQGRTYIAYTIKYGNKTVRRRYSEFESLRKILIKLFPMTLIPPIPEKQSLTSYGKSIAGSKASYLLPSEAAGSVDLSLSVINGSVNTNDEKLIRHRIRMLTSFLNRLLKNKEVTKTSIITDFLDPNNTNWSDVITSSATISSLPKSALQCNPLDPTNTTKAHAYLPVPSSSSQLLHKDAVGGGHFEDPDDGFNQIDHEYKEYEGIINDGFYKYNRRITKNLFALRQDMKELSEAFAEFANDQKRGAELAEQLSHFSNAFDESAIELESIVGKLYYNINEPLSESVHMAGAARELLRYRKLKMVQKDILNRTLLYRKAQLKKFQEQEQDAKQIDDFVGQQMKDSGHINLQHPEAKSYSGKFFNKINKFASMVRETVSYQDADPAMAKSNLERDIDQLTESLQVSEKDLKIISATIRDIQLPSFASDRSKEVSEIFKNYSRYLEHFANKNLEIWHEVKNRQNNLADL